MGSGRHMEARMEAAGQQQARQGRARGGWHPFRRNGWQVFVLLGVTAMLGWQLPRKAVLYAPRAFAPFPEPRAAYVVLTPAEAAKALAGMRSPWRVAEADGGAASELDMGMFELREEPAPPAFLEQGARYPGAWRPSPVEPLQQPLPELGAPSAVGAGQDGLPAAAWPLAPPQGLVTVCSDSLTDAAFSFPPPSGPLPERAGECRFYLETDGDGAVAHLLLLSPAGGASAAALERALGRGRAGGAARGLVTLLWNFPK